MSLVFLAGLVWCAFQVKLGRRTFAEHVDRIGETTEARELLDSTRRTVTPFVEDATDRMLGEHIEAPTARAPEHPSAPRTAGRSLDERAEPGAGVPRRGTVRSRATAIAASP